MYIVLTAMLALNVSSDVLNGFTQVEEGLTRTNANVEERNASILKTLEAFAEQNPDKGQRWYDKASEVRRITAELYRHIDTLKQRIVREADGADGDINDIQSRDNLEAASVVMLSGTHPRGEKLRKRIDNYRNYITALMPDSLKRKSVEKSLSTAPVLRKGTLGKQSWAESKFDNQPVVAAITLLTKLQNDVKYAEGEALLTLLNNVDAGDVRVNELNAFVIPQSRFVMRGGKYSANIVLAAVDTTARPEIFINGTKLGNDKGLYEFNPGTTGTFDYKGYLEVPHGDGTVTRHPFQSSYTVIEPTATVSATMMNVLYAGIDNPISISVPGIPMNAVQATMTNGSLTRSGDHWVAHPGKVGTEAVISVTAQTDGRSQQVGSMTFRVRKLPDPSPYLAYKDASGNTVHYKGTPKRISKAQLMAADGIGAAIDDDILNVTYQVVSFSTVFFDQMGNAIPEVSEGSHFSARQKEQFKRLKAGKNFFISGVKAKGPDGITRDISPMEVALN
jgi:gliding motility-associated protein GldM